MTDTSLLYNYRATVTRIVDGDTIDAILDLGFGVTYKTRIRLAKFDAPEIISASCSEERQAGLDAAQFLADTLKDKEVIIATVKDRKDKYGRYLGYILVNGTCLNDVLVEKHSKKPEWGKFQTLQS